MEKYNERKLDIDDHIKLHLTYGINFAVLLNKDHSRIYKNISAVKLKKKLSNTTLTNLNESQNNYILHDRVTVEICFGCMCAFGLFVHKWRRGESKYRIFFQTRMVLTNMSIFFNGLQDHDYKHFILVHDRTPTFGKQSIQKRAMAQAQYRKNRRRILSD